MMTDPPVSHHKLVKPPSTIARALSHMSDPSREIKRKRPALHAADALERARELAWATKTEGSLPDQKMDASETPAKVSKMPNFDDAVVQWVGRTI
ncbi:MAG TPA: hypothetical protein VNW30_03445 [Opitutaceae bacterium]|jgi:hypothetical protein|nr:hypothetical protein [Opitutaceae bacterium]